MKTPAQKLKDHWARRFVDVTAEWPYWWIEGDSCCLAVIDGGNLAAAVEIVEDNWDRFDSIKVYRAKLLDSDLIRREMRNAVVSERTSSRRKLDDWEKEAIAYGSKG